MTAIGMATAGRLPGMVRVAPDPTEAAEAAAMWLAKLSAAARQRHGYFSIALSRDRVWDAAYRRLAKPPYRDAVYWPSWYILFTTGHATRREVDGDPASAELLLDSVPIDPDRVLAMPVEGEDPHTAATDYSELLEALFPRGPGGAPRLDCILLELTADGHTAGLSEGLPASHLRHIWVGTGLDTLGHSCLTITYPVINAGAAVAFMVTGAGAAQVLRDVGRGTAAAAAVQPSDGELWWFVDEEALNTAP